MNGIVYSTLNEINRGGCEVFFNSRGRPYKSVRNAFEKAVKEAGINDFRFHDLRHTFASWLVMRGASLTVVGRILGHKTPQMTTRYAHLAEDYLADTVELLTQN